MGAGYMKARNKFPAFSALMAGLILLFGIAYPQAMGEDSANLSRGIQSEYCSMPCCAEEKSNSQRCCCAPLPAPKGKSSPLGGNQLNTDRFVDLLVLDSGTLSPVDALKSRLDMVGYTVGLRRAAPPPVKLFIFNEAFLS